MNNNNNEDFKNHTAATTTTTTALAIVPIAAGPSKPRRKRRTKISIEGAATPPSKPRNKMSRPLSPGRCTCTECGKDFLSKKALFGHMRCHPERDWRGINPPTTRRHVSSIDDDYEVAACLLMLSSSSSLSDHNRYHQDSVIFECSSCKKVFRSHQALGGHRASHKNVKGCFAMAAHCSSPPNYMRLGFDLNLPAPVDDHESECCITTTYSSALVLSSDNNNNNNNYNSSISNDCLDLSLAL